MNVEASFSMIIGQDRPVGILQRAISSGRIAQAYLFSGPDGVGKATTALVFARVINQEGPSFQSENYDPTESDPVNGVKPAVALPEFRYDPPPEGMLVWDVSKPMVALRRCLMRTIGLDPERSVAETRYRIFFSWTSLTISFLWPFFHNEIHLNVLPGFRGTL